MLPPTESVALLLTAEIVELPHHGSFGPEALAFVRGLQPRVVLQSTGHTRWRRDKWAGLLPGVERMVTARDGACLVEIHDDVIVVERFTGGRRTIVRSPILRHPESPAR